MATIDARVFDTSQLFIYETVYESTRQRAAIANLLERPHAVVSKDSITSAVVHA